MTFPLGNVERKAFRDGIALSCANNVHARIPVGQDWEANGTVVFVARINSVDNPWGGIFSKLKSGTSAQVSMGRSNNSAYLYLEHGSSTDITSPNIAIPTGSVAVHAMSWTTGNNAVSKYYLNGAYQASTTAISAGTPTGTGDLLLGSARDASATYDSDVDFFLFAKFAGVLSDSAIAELSKNPWQIFRKSPGRIYFFPSAGGGAITGSGTPAAQSATVAGTATRTITGSGTPSAQAATAAGTAEREITGSGAPVSQYATVAGTGSVSAGISGSGVLSAQSATVAGTATRTVTASGTPSAQSATVAGTAEREVTGSGTPSAQSATVVGTGQIGNIVTGSGAPAAQSATVAGTAEREITSSGAVSAQSATVAGTGVRVITGTGSPTAQDATVYGYDVAPQTAHNTGGGGSRKMLLSERKVRDEVDEWLKKKREQEMLARIQREDEELVLILALVA